MDINTKPTVISTFAGTGGSSLGYHWSGYKELLAIDWEEHAVECFKANFQGVPIWHKDITKVTAEEILNFTGLKVGELDVFDGSPPCQGFSTAGKREVSDSRNDLFLHYFRLINELQPKVFVMENVSGMIKGVMKGKFIEIMNTLKSTNYNVKAKLMNAMYYGVPQARQRMIFIGVRKDLHVEPSFPQPSQKIVTTIEALQTVKAIGFHPPITNVFMKANIGNLKPGNNFATLHPNKSYFNSSRLPITRPAGTITKTYSGTFHPLENRSISINECKVLCSFPESWKLGDDFRKAWARLGNAVMPKFMQAIASHISSQILSRIDVAETKSSQPIDSQLSI